MVKLHLNVVFTVCFVLAPNFTRKFCKHEGIYSDLVNQITSEINIFLENRLINGEAVNLVKLYARKLRRRKLTEQGKIIGGPQAKIFSP